MEVSRKRYKTGKRLQSAKPLPSTMQRERDTKLNVQRRQKLAFTLIESLVKKLKAEKNTTKKSKTRKTKFRFMNT